MNSKAQLNLYYIIVAFGMLAMMTIFSMVFIYEIGKSEIIAPIANISLEIHEDLNTNPQYPTVINNLVTKYNDLDFAYDLFFLAFWIASIVTTIGVAVKTRKTGVVGFLGGLFMGTMGLLLVMFFIDQIADWFFTNIFYAVFDDITLNLPIMTYYFDNIGWISAVWFLSLLLLNQLELKIDGGRTEE